MIIQCKSCSRKFVVKDKDIPDEGRVVKCGYCSVTWHQMPTSIPLEPVELEDIVLVKQETNVGKKASPEQMKASDGKTYQLLNNQWAQLLPSGKTGIFAKKKIISELNKITGRKKIKPFKKKTKILDPSSAATGTSGKRLPDIYKPQDGIGFFGYIFLILIISLSILGVIKTFEEILLNNFPQTEFIYELLDQQLNYFLETIKNMIIIFNDLLNSY